MHYLVTGPGAKHMIRYKFSQGREVRVMGPNAFVLDEEPTPVQPCTIAELEYCNWDQLPAWSPIGDTAYYDGLLVGHFGTVCATHGNSLVFLTGSGLRITTDQPVWVAELNYWYTNQHTVISVENVK